MKMTELLKRTSAALLVLIMLISIMPSGVFATELPDPGELGNNPYMWAKARFASISTFSLGSELDGKGTAAEPYLIKTAEDMDVFAELVSDGQSFGDEYLKLTSDITLSEGWSGVGPQTYSGLNGKGLTPFCGTFDGGNHTITIPSGGKGLFNYLREATVQNLNVKGTYIDGCALLNNYIVDYGDDGNYNTGTGGSYEDGCPDTATFTNVHIVGNTKIKNSGFASGYASGGNTIIIQDCSVGSGVILGCDPNGNSLDQDNVGSFGGEFNGFIRNSVSAATVLGKKNIGGIAGSKGQTMGHFSIINCQFAGSVQASGNYTGGIVGSGYTDSSARNTPGVDIIGCSVTGTVSGKNAVGGIFGGEGGQVQAWDNQKYGLADGRILDNHFLGSLSSPGKYVGGIIGYMKSLNRFNVISGNTYSSEGKGIGGVNYVDTNAIETDNNNPTVIDGVTYINTSLEKLPAISGFDKEDHNRTDDPLRADKAALAAGNISPSRLEISDNYIDEYFVGQEFTLQDVKFKLHLSDETFVFIDPSLIEITGYDSHTLGEQSVTLAYKPDPTIELTIKVTVKADNVASLSINPTKFTCWEGSDLDLSSAVITATLTDGTTEEVQQRNLDIKGYDKTKIGKQEVTLEYGQKTAEIEVTVQKRTVTKLTVTKASNFKTSYKVGESFSLTGAEVTATWSDGTTSKVPSTYITVHGFDSTKAGKCNVQFEYKGYEGTKSDPIEITITGSSSSGSGSSGSSGSGSGNITVSFTLLGDDIHKNDYDGTKKDCVHVMADDVNLKTWIAAKSYTVPAGSTVRTVFEKACAEHGYSYENPKGNYVESINGLAEFTNGPKSGWMYTLNGNYPNLGVDEQTLHDSDVIIFHYTDEHRAERMGGYAGTRKNLAFGGTWKKQYQGQPLDKSGIFIIQNWISSASDGGEAFVTNPPIDKVNLSGYSEDTAGSQTITASYKGTTGTATITSVKVKSISVTGYEKEWVKGTEFNLNSAGVKITATYEDGTSKSLAASKINKIEGFEKDTLGSQKIKISYGDISCTLEDVKVVTQKSPSASGSTVSSNTLSASLEEVSEEIGHQFATAGDYLFNTIKKPTVGSIGGEWTILGMSRAGYPVTEGYFEDYYENVVQYVEECNGILHDKKYTDYSRVVLALTSIGKDARDVAGYDLVAPLADFDQVCWQGINGPIWALIALDSANYPAPEAIPGKTRTTRAALIQHILDNEVTGGGWSLGGAADVDITAMAIQALAPYCDTNAQVKEAVERGLTVLSNKQSDRGGFSNGTEPNSESCAQVIVALTALGIDPAEDARFIKNGRSVLDALNDFAVEDGGFKHILDGEVNGMATEQAYYALTAYARLRNGDKRLYDMTDINDFGGDPVIAPVETTEPAKDAPLEDEPAETSDFPVWAVITIGACSAAGIVLFLNRKKLFI